MTVGGPIERISKPLVEHVRLRVEPCVDEITAAPELERRLGWRERPDLVHQHGDTAGRLALDVFGPEGGDDQQLGVGHVTGEVQQQIDGAGIRPVEIVDRDQHGSSCGEAGQHRRALVEQRLLLSRRVLGPERRLPDGHPQAVAQRMSGKSGVESFGQRLAVDQRAEQVRPGVEDHLDRRRHVLPELCRLRLGERTLGPSSFDVAAQQRQDLAEREVGVTCPGEGVARPP